MALMDVITVALAGGALTLSALAMRRKADRDFADDTRHKVERLEQDVAACERQHQACEEDRRSLQKDILAITRKLVNLESTRRQN